jgi:hypothetical protein
MEIDPTATGRTIDPPTAIAKIRLGPTVIVPLTVIETRRDRTITIAPAMTARTVIDRKMIGRTMTDPLTIGPIMIDPITIDPTVTIDRTTRVLRKIVAQVATKETVPTIRAETKAAETRAADIREAATRATITGATLTSLTVAPTTIARTMRVQITIDPTMAVAMIGPLAVTKATARPSRVRKTPSRSFLAPNPARRARQPE